MRIRVDLDPKPKHCYSVSTRLPYMVPLPPLSSVGPLSPSASTVEV